MIITRLIGGLGNQMFQYAAGRRAAYINNTELKLDITGYEKQEGITPRKYMLQIFNINEDFANMNEIVRFKGLRKNFFIRYFLKLTNRIVPYYKQSYVKQKSFQFDPNILKVGKDTYLEGSWATEKYFQDVEDIIRKDFIFKNAPDARNKKRIEQIKRTTSISIHFRRGDYVLDKKTHDFHGMCDHNYYDKAIKIITKTINQPYFFIFSDDPKWVKNNFKIEYPVEFIDRNTGDKSYEDMRLMSLCKHNIIANSSFSWWGAWLNKNPERVVIAPRNWFKEKKLNTKDLIPESWKII